MARGKGGNRNQARDARGRFASTGTPKASRAKPKATGGTAAAQSSLKRSRAKLAENPTPAQKGAVTRAKNKLSAARKANTSRQKIGSAPKQSVIKRRPGKPSKPSAPANGIRPTGTLPRLQPASKIVPTNRRAQRRAPLGLKANAIRTFNPKTPQLGIGQMERRLDRRIDDFDKGMKKVSDAMKSLKPKVDKVGRKIQRMNAQAIQDRFSKSNADRFVAGVELNTIGGRMGAKAIQRRMQRAADAASRGSKPAARAREIYGNQLAYMGTGKPKAAKNNLRPGPRNTQGPPKTRKPRRKK
jgi:hypothetical protein